MTEQVQQGSVTAEQKSTLERFDWQWCLRDQRRCWEKQKSIPGYHDCLDRARAYPSFSNLPYSPWSFEGSSNLCLEFAQVVGLLPSISEDRPVGRPPKTDPREVS